MKKALLIFFALLLPFNAFGDEAKTDFTKHYDTSLFKVSENGLFSVEIVPKDHELKVGENQLDIILHDNDDKDVAGATISVTPWMPEMGHGVSEKARVTEMGGGLYNAENVVLNMGGLWELRIAIKKGSMEDKTVISLPGVKSAGAHGHEMDKTPEAASDTATEKMSQKGLFWVSYESDTRPIPVNTFHSWVIQVRNKEGQPVGDADIDIDGDMPAHGHGLPTEPEVSGGAEEGLYEIEGLKFSMPGRWVMQFRISSGDMEDTVTFHLDVP